MCQTVTVILHQTGAVDAAVLAVVPINGDIAQSFFGAPPVVSHHGHKFAEVDDFDDAAPVIHFAAVYRLSSAAEHRRMSDGCMQHARQLHVHAKADLAGDDIGDIHARQRFACQGPGFRVFERNVFGWCQFGCLGCQLAVAEFFVAGVVQHMTEHGLAFADWHAPSLGCGFYQHNAGGGTGFAQIVLRHANSATADTSHVAVGALAAQVFMRRHIDHTHFLPIGFQFFSDQHGRRGAAALAHFGARIAYDDGLVAVYLYPSVDFCLIGGHGGIRPDKAQTERGSGAAADL